MYCLLWICALAGLTAADGHYRCTWHHEVEHSHDHPTDVTAQHVHDTTTGKPAQCSHADSLKMTSYVNHCTRQNYVPLMSCNSDGTWNCQSFVSLCKTLIRQEEATQPLMSLLPPQTINQPETKSNIPPVSLPKFNPNENYFTMKQMGIAVLVSFITGATMLAIVILIVWRCRHANINSEQRMDIAHQDAKRMAALHAITQIATAFVGAHEGQTITVSNPNYAQVISSKDILDDVLTEHDRVYEEIISRRRSSCKHAECIYTNIDRSQIRNSKRRRQSQTTSTLKVIDESMERTTNTDDITTSGVCAVKNNTTIDDVNGSYPYAVIKKINNNMTKNVPQSPRIGVERNLVNYKQDGKGKEDDSNVVDKDTEISATDSGFMDELFDSGMETAKIGTTEDEDLPLGQRKDSLRM